MKRNAVVLLASALLFLTGCSTDTAVNTGQDAKTTVAVTIVPQKTFVQAVCGDLAEVLFMVPPGSSPENYEPAAAQMEDFSKSSLYFTIGMPIEDASILPKADGISGMKVVKLQHEAAAKYADREFAPGERDPHIWLSPKRVKVMVAAIAREMGRLDPENKETYDSNAKKYMKQLDTLDEQIKTILAGVKNKKFIVFHPAFGYLADDYGLTMYALEEEGKEATPKHMQEMIDLAKQEGIKAIFYQEEIDSRQSESFAEELGGKTVRLEPLAADYIENLKKMATTLAEVMQ